MLSKLWEENILSFRYLTAECVYGENDDFISVSCDALFWLKMPATVKRKYKRNGEVRQKTVLADPSNKPLTVKEFAKNLNDHFWYKRKMLEGTKGPIEYEFTKRRVVLSKEELPRKTVWLIIKRTLGDKKEYSFFEQRSSQ